MILIKRILLFLLFKVLEIGGVIGGIWGLIYMIQKHEWFSVVFLCVTGVWILFGLYIVCRLNWDAVKKKIPDKEE